ncbi:MAG TPA: two-component regulator propeller domain-containing protein, partial [Cellvibrio sp.]|nr:two-component regulator propeller domain-containing protein [Cellvibrio sp.]
MQAPNPFIRISAGMAQFICLLFLATYLLVPKVSAAPEPAREPRSQPLNYSFRHVLPDQVAGIGYINAIAQDAEGFMWFGGANGLARYDGYNLVIFRRDEKDPHSLSNDYVNDIRLAADGSLWIATRKGINHYDARLNRFTRYSVPAAAAEAISGDDVMAIEQTPDGRLWLATRAGLYSFSPAETRFQHHPLGDTGGAGSDGLLWAVVRDHQGMLWIGHQDRGITRYDPATGASRRYQEEQGLGFEDIRELYVDSSNNLWVGSYGAGLFTLDTKRERFVAVKHDNQEKSAVVWSVLEDRSGNLWVGDGSAVYVHAPGAKKFRRFSYDEANPSSPGNFVVNKLFEDAAGDIWSGYFPAGIDVVDRQASIFNNYRYSATDPNTVTEGGVLSAVKDERGNLWIGAGYGLNYFEPEKQKFTRYRYDPNNPASMGGNTVLSIAMGVDRQLWLGILSGGLNRLDMDSGKFIHYRPDASNPNAIRGREGWSVIRDQQGYIWIATEEGLNRYDPASDSFRYFVPTPEQLDGDKLLYARVVYQDKQGNIWVGGIRGLYRFDPQRETFTRYHHVENDPTSLSADFVLAIYEDSRGRFWVGTDGGGINLLDRATGRFTAFASSDGLADDVVAGIMEDPQGYLWLGTQKGIARFDVEKKQFRNFDKRHGLNDNMFNRNTPLVMDGGELFFGNSKGFVVFDPAAITTNEYSPPVVFTNLLILNKPVEVGVADS